MDLKQKEKKHLFDKLDVTNNKIQMAKIHLYTSIIKKITNIDLKLFSTFKYRLCCKAYQITHIHIACHCHSTLTHKLLILFNPLPFTPCTAN